MDADSSSASKYLNNLLAARGLLKGGHKIAFDSPAEDETTPSRIINLVHDLVRRRDKDADQKETLAMGIKALKESESKANTLADRYKSRCEELERRCATLQGQERVLNANVRSAEITAKALKDETSRLKVMVQQVRTQCANDIRKRDHQLAKLKDRLLEKSRGGRGNKQPTAFPGVALSGSAAFATTSQQGSYTDAATSGIPTDQTLTEDTTAILTELSQNLADENDTLVSMIQSTVTTLKAISGMDTDVDPEAELEDGERNVIANDVSHAALSAEVDDVLEHLKEMLTQPNYVPVEDLDMRDREIERLRAQLQGTLEAWKNAIALVDLVNKKPDAVSSKQVRTLEGVVERERQTVLGEIDVNVQTAPADTRGALEDAAAHDEEEHENVWQEGEDKVYESKSPVKKVGFQVAEVHDVEEVEVVADGNEEYAVEEEEGAAYQEYEDDGVQNEEYGEEEEEEGGDETMGYGQYQEGDVEEVIEEEAPTLDREEDSVDLIPPIQDDDSEDESSMELLSPIKPSMYKKRPLASSPIAAAGTPAVKRARFLDAGPRRRGRLNR
ncbi:hypothetical protein DRE_05133 [Drechslerella stenobrocha 248]|uniref:NIMA interactive protein n=1 Tax=Drechslerella stenobrocha 248 TaxID=1043628 RepID=W7HNX7_9PEZI|nr:hypothetical protein DRE_05133 [Drechslerella stenobrocha 248]